MRRVEFRSPAKADVAVLSRNLELWPELSELTKAFPTIEVETIKSPINLRDLFEVILLTRQKRASIGYASMSVQLRKSGAKVLLAVDQTSEVIEELGRLNPELGQVVVPHGSQKKEILTDYNRIRHRPRRVLCVWGQNDVDAYREFVEDGVNCEIVGSLRNAYYVSMHGLDSERRPTRPLLFVSQYSGSEEVVVSSDRKRNRLLQAVKELTRQFCLERNLPLTIALRPPVSAPHAPGHRQAEVQHYRDVFKGISLSFTDPSVRFSTYLASDYSDVTIGVPSGALTESFGRGNKVLMIRQHPDSGTYFGFPIDGEWLLTEPNYEQFAARLDYLRSVSRKVCAERWKDAREYMTAGGETEDAIGNVQALIQKAISGVLA